ncbi:carboxypeptidase regulatory-like domain-containing protein [Flavobacterium muglaense]|uniref:Carboxypeptidase regulatory-like domain-containing protein n=1 Tax=Flavobacterium muglaense TaxID=2764716 RepID=A0A923SFK8_9FLAO|nr:carboxypeptidase regulatory-like domain-containing protein [Flavobacterium muglaense]MBC5838210.1 carboxypeptidase regulatory-like domain-containing protein [Flavobacterium muglaense]MBC5844706.1 carboxypeptidase regulatory-like domain-containing protein [Flavobacterium muglaense]
MKNIYLIISFLIVFVMASCSEEKAPGEEYGTVEGKVVSAVDFTPLANVKVFSSPNTSIVFTDADGKFTVPNVKVGDYSFEAQKDAYVSKFEAATVNVGQTTSLVFELKLSTTNNKPPVAPTLVSPLENAIDQPLSVNLSWTATDPDDDALKYEVTLRNDNNSDVIVYQDIAVTNFTITGLTYSTKYYFQVSASDGINPPVLSTVRSFTTLPFPNGRFLFVKKISDNNVIYSGDENGNQLQITSSNVNSWRPRKNNQSNKIAFIRASGAQNHIYTMNPDGTAVTKVTNSVPIAGFNPDYLNFSWDSSGSQIIYPYFDKLYRINKDGSGLTQLYQTPNGKFISECDWSNDGSKIALKVNDASGYKTEIYVINTAGVVVNQIISGTTGAIGGLNFAITGQKLLFTRDVSGFENENYRQLDTQVFQYDFSTSLITQIGIDKPLGTLDLDARYSPNESELIIVNTSNDGLSVKNIVRFTPNINNLGASRAVLFSNAYMPDWE